MATPRFRAGLVALCAFYLLIELVYVARLPLAMDEFQFAAEIERLGTHVPYRDFRPYKNLLGYFLQAFPLAIGKTLSLSPWENLIWLKSAIALGVAVTLGWAGDRLRRVFTPSSILLATTLLVVMSTFLERSAVIRVDMLASLFALVGAIFVLERRALLAGLFVGLAFLVTQKAAYFVIASGAAFAADLLDGRERARAIGDLGRLAVGALAPLLLYLGVFIAVAGAEPVFRSMFVDSSQVALWTDYADKRLGFWWQTLSRNPAFYALAALGLVALLAPGRLGAGEPSRPARRRIGAYAFALTALCMWHRQPWPYFFVLLIPTAWIAIAAAFEAMSRRHMFESPTTRVVAVAALFVLGIALPLTRVPTVLARSNAYQRSTFELLDDIVGPGETYLAGTNILYHAPFQPASFGWLDRRQLASLAVQDAEARRALIEELDRAPVKAFVSNYRTQSLPDEVKRYVGLRFRHVHGPVWTHAPQCDVGRGRLGVRFSGDYRLHVSPGTTYVEIDGQAIHPGDVVPLAVGWHAVATDGHCQVQFVPKGLEAIAEAGFSEERRLFENVYDY